MKLERWEKAMFVGMAVVVYTGIVFLIGVIFGVASQYKEDDDFIDAKIIDDSRE